MLDANHVPIIGHRTATVGQDSFADCFETALRNATNFICFNEGAFDPTVWKEGSILRQFYTDFQHTTPHDSRLRSLFAAAVAKKEGVLYYTPSKKINDVTNTAEAIPGIINMFKILAHLGLATDATWEHIAQLETLSPKETGRQFEESFKLLMNDLTDSSVVLEYVDCTAGKIVGYSDFKGNIEVKLKDRPRFEWKFHANHSVFEYNAPVQTHVETASAILSGLPLFADLKAHYTDLTTLITPEITHEDLTTLLMSSDLLSPDLRLKVMPILLESHMDLPLITTILKQVEKENDYEEVSKVTKIFTDNLNRWLDDVTKRETVISLLRSMPKFFSNDYPVRNLLLKRFNEKSDSQAKALAIELIENATNIYFGHSYADALNDPSFPYLEHFRNATTLNCSGILDDENSLSKINMNRIHHVNNISIYQNNGTFNHSLFRKLSSFSKLTSIGLSGSVGLSSFVGGSITDTFDTQQLASSIDQLPQSLEQIELYGFRCNGNWREYEEFWRLLCEKRPHIDIKVNTCVSGPGVMVIEKVYEKSPVIKRLIEEGKISLA